MPFEANAGPTELNLAGIHVDRRNADLVLTGDDRVVHLEFQHRADPTMADRMLIYHSLLRVEPAYTGKRIQQHVIVLGKGHSPTRIDDPPNLHFAFETHHARDVTPESALADPLTAPWAMLATAQDNDERRTRLLEVLRKVRSAESESLVQDLTNTAVAFAAIAMKREDIEGVLRETSMPADMIHDTEFAQELIDEGHAAGLAEGLAQAERRTQEHVLRLLAHRDVGPRTALRIAEALIEQDPATSVERAAFEDLEQLIDLAGQ